MATAKPLTNIRKAFASKGDDVTFSRWVKTDDPKPAHGKPKQLVLIGLGHPTIEAGRSIFYRKGVSAPNDAPLVSGHNNVKIGRDVRKGWFRGYWIYTLSLEERATCPRSCIHWYDCYGNHMPFARRFEHGAALEQAIEGQLERLLAPQKPGRGGKRLATGALIRLHALGDFYSIRYVDFWRQMLQRFDNLAVYGYTAHPWSSTIGQRLMLGAEQHGNRWMVRHSDGGYASMWTVSITKPEDCPPDAFVCPEQTGQTKGCGTCGACWQTSKNVAFLGH